MELSTPHGLTSADLDVSSFPNVAEMNVFALVSLNMVALAWVRLAHMDARHLKRDNQYVSQ